MDVKEKHEITTLDFQRKNKPKIEDALPYYLNGEMIESALDFVAFLRANKMNPVWGGVHNQWKHVYKGKGLYVINLFDTNPNGEKKKWAIEPYLKNITQYEDLIINEKLQNYIWDNASYCRNVLTGGCNSHGCAPGITKTIVGKEIKNVCLAHAHLGRRIMVAYEPDKATIECIKKLLGFERKTRLDEFNHASKAAALLYPREFNECP